MSEPIPAKILQTNIILAIIGGVITASIIGIGGWVGGSIQTVSIQLGRIDERLVSVQKKVDSRDAIFSLLQDQYGRTDERLKALEERFNNLRSPR